MTGEIFADRDAVLRALQTLYGQYGYSRYKMNKFEEYDLYARNKDFLISDSIITFTDGNGKLLALKPDVTLSIVKNSKDSELQKLYYNENVYRAAKDGGKFKEIMQVGLECIGEVDDYVIYEVLGLALQSLGTICADHMLCVSHLGVLSEVMNHLGVPSDGRKPILRCIGAKNMHELTALLRTFGVEENGITAFCELLRLKGDTATVLKTLENRLKGLVCEETLSRFLRVLDAWKKEPALCIDFSVVNDLHYYNGFVFKGYVEGISGSVLSGGQYDKLMKKMGRSSLAVGFAVYLDLIGQFHTAVERYDVDTVLLYDDATPVTRIAQEVCALQAKGDRVRAGRVLPGQIKYKRLCRMTNGEVEVVEQHD